MHTNYFVIFFFCKGKLKFPDAQKEGLGNVWRLLFLSFPVDYPLVSPFLSFHLHELQKTAVLLFVNIINLGDL